MHPLLALLALIAAQGFVTHDLTDVEDAARTALGKNYIGRATPTQIIFTCATWPGEPMIAVEIGRQSDGTEARIRSGATTIADMERLCRARSPECTIGALPVAPAVGWVSAYRIGDSSGATAVVIRDGDLLTIRSLASDAAAARRGIDMLLPVLRDKVIGAPAP